MDILSLKEEDMDVLLLQLIVVYVEDVEEVVHQDLEEGDMVELFLQMMDALVKINKEESVYV